MSSSDRTRPEQIRALIEEADRIRRESERMTSELDRSMKRPFWPDRRRTIRINSSTDDERGSGDDAA